MPKQYEKYHYDNMESHQSVIDTNELELHESDIKKLKDMNLLKFSTKVQNMQP